MSINFDSLVSGRAIGRALAEIFGVPSTPIKRRQLRFARIVGKKGDDIDRLARLLDRRKK